MLNSKKKRSRRDTEQKGFIILFCSLLVAVILAFAAFSVDLGQTYYEQRKIQIAADAAALAALNVLGSGTNYSSVLARVQSVASYNGVTNAEVTQVHPRCGIWSGSAFTPQTIDTCNSSTNAVKVTIYRTVSTMFARVFGITQTNPVVTAISYLPPANICIRPFGIEGSFLLATNVQVGQTFVIGVQNSGNWGKLDVGGNLSSGPAFENAMLNDACSNEVGVGNQVSPGTGNAGMQNVFQTILNDTTPPLAAQNMILAVTSDFPTGNSSPVTIQKFIKVNLISKSGNGSNWTATFQLVEDNATPNPSATSSTRTLVQ